LLPSSCEYVSEFSLSLSLVFTTLFSIFTSLLSLALYLSRRSLLKKLGDNDSASSSSSTPFSTLCAYLLDIFHSVQLRPTDQCVTPTLSRRTNSLTPSPSPQLPRVHIVAASPRSNSPSIRIATSSPIHNTCRLNPVPQPRRSRYLSTTETSFLSFRN